MKYDPNTGEPIYNNTTTNNKSNGFAIAGFICALLVGSITGIIFSAIGLSKVKETGKGKGLAVAGIVISIVRLILIPIIGVLYTTLVWPSIRSNIVQSAHCSEAYDCKDVGDGNLSCKYVDFDESIKTVTCPKGSYTGGTPTTKTVTTKPTTTNINKEDKEPINVYVFYGSGCPHCEDLFKYLDKLSQDKTYAGMFKVVKYETWYNDDNASLLNDAYDYFKVTEPKGVPFYVIGDQYFSGFPSDSKAQETTGSKIKFAIINAYTNPSYKDVIKSL